MSLSSIYYNNYRVVNLGAKPDGRTDSTKAFRSAWDKACASVNPAVIHVPRGTFLLGNAIFRGPCNNNAITFRIAEGTRRFPIRLSGPWKCWYNWLLFQDVHGLNISSSHGILDGQGTGLWDCKASLGKSNCPTGAIVRNFNY
ncbi:polygalacturonase-like [Prunus yedoensis var. nudiflora]|uniref:Polygalacturonase-like n=1 Tax=Prunus yedoensis var. nudiflora TaxID=2094558 RepID=A0A314UG80_PRUYE|nr:polygalacturonase-like [Prunus yedoensis var. nudiflora]